MKTYTGIDNGLDGGIVTIDADGEMLQAIPMPTFKTGKGREVDIVAIASLIANIGGTFLLENASKHSPGKMALCSTWFTFGQIKAALMLEGARYELVHSQHWQREFWTRPKMPKGQKFDTKAAALNAANRIWPGNQWLASNRCTKPHDGMVDAALIAEFGRRKGI